MAGHSKYANIKHRKAAQDSKRTKIFTRISRQITVAAKSGGADPDSNPSLRLMIAKAKYHNLPNDRIDRAIKASTAGSGDGYEDVTYEGYGPKGVAVIVECLTDNRNRTASELRSCFSKYAGNLGVTGSVSHAFRSFGMVSFTDVEYEKAFEVGINNEAISVEEKEDEGTIIVEMLCEPNNFANFRDKCSDIFSVSPYDYGIIRVAEHFVTMSSEEAVSTLKMINILQDNDDVQRVFSNLKIVDEK